MRRMLVVVGFLTLALATSAWAARKPQPKTKPVAARGMALTVGASLARGNLTVFPVYAPERRKVSSEYLTLDEALKQKLLVVKELPAAEVNRVSVTNKASQPIYLMAGDIILGGQQDREVARDTIVQKGATDFAVEVFCVEHGRWAGGAHFSAGEIASASLRLETQRTKQQQKVWDRVAQEVGYANRRTPTGTYRAVAAHQASQKEIGAYVNGLVGPLAKDARAVGVVVAINGQVTAADVFADHKLFVKQLPKVLKSYALDATQQQAEWAKQRAKPKPSQKDAVALLAEGERGPARTTAASGTTVNQERESDLAYTYDAAPVSAAKAAGGFGGAPAHRNIYRKK